MPSVALTLSPIFNMDLFTPIVPHDKQHPNFRAMLHESHAPTRKVLLAWAQDFVDRDGKFVHEFQTTFNSCFWELYLFAVTKQLKYPVDFSIPSPDLVVDSPYGRFAMEAAIASHANKAIPEWQSAAIFKELKDQTKKEFVDEACIRLSNALQGKHRRFQEHYRTVSAVRDIPFVVAIAPFDRPHAFSQNTEAILRVLYGFNARPVRQGNGVSVEVIRERMMRKPNGAEIPLGLFTDDRMKDISAVVFSNTATMGKLRALSDDEGMVLFGVVTYQRGTLVPRYEVKQKHEYREGLLDGLLVFHNPFAARPLDQRALFDGGIVQYSFDVESQMPTDNVRDGCLIQRFCFKMVQRKAKTDAVP